MPAEHRAAPEWRDQVIYFAMLDRFADGDRSNNDQHRGEFDPADGRKFSGGDLAGATAQLDYLHELGATALWITPPVANQWWNPRSNYGGYHGYWATDFAAIDAHFGSVADYRALADGLHRRGMALIQDIVLNHTADYFHWTRPYDPARPQRGFVRSRDSQGRLAPTQFPFDRNDARDRAQRELGIYHWTPSIVDYGNPTQLRDWQLADLDDLNTENPLVRAALRKSYGRWIREVGVDAFRVDTAFYVPPELFADFLDSEDPAAPGVRRVAAASGRSNFLAFGEGFGVEAPYGDAVSRRIAGYLEAPGHPGLPSMLEFPLYSSLGDVFARGQPSAVLADRIERSRRLFAHPETMPTFVDNHDVERFLAGGNETGLRQALLAILTLPGIPTLYYGTEQGFREQRASMFAGGYGSGGVDHYDRSAPLYRYLKEAIALRRGHPSLTRGAPSIVARNAAGPGALGWRMDAADLPSLLVLVNSADHPVLLDRLDAALPPGAQLRPLFAIDGTAPALRADGAGQIGVVLPAGAGYVWQLAAAADAVPATRSRVTIEPLANAAYHDALVVAGAAPGIERVRLVVDGDVERGVVVAVAPDGRWTGRIATQSLTDPAIVHRLVAWPEGGDGGAAAAEFRVERQWTTVARVEDAAGDDHGPHGAYRYPTDASFHPPSLDLRAVEAATSETSLRLTVTLGALSSAWNAANGFDRLLLNVFIELPGRSDGVRVLPLQNDVLPADMRWHYRLRVGGWSNPLFAATGAGADHEGRAVSGSAQLAVDREQRTIALTLPAALLGDPATLHGARIWVNTWDYDAGYRGLARTPAGMRFGGGDGARDPLWMDASPILVLP